MKHQMQLRIYYQDTDAGGIVYHSNYLNFAERARAEMLVEMGLLNSELVKQGIAFVLRNATLDYRRPARLDDIITVQTRILEIKNVSMLMEQTFYRDDEILVVVRLQLAFVNPETLRPVRMPEPLKELFVRYLKEN